MEKSDSLDSLEDILNQLNSDGDDVPNVVGKIGGASGPNKSTKNLESDSDNSDDDDQQLSERTWVEEANVINSDHQVSKTALKRSDHVNTSEKVETSQDVDEFGSVSGLLTTKEETDTVECLNEAINLDNIKINSVEFNNNLVDNVRRNQFAKLQIDGAIEDESNDEVPRSIKVTRSQSISSYVEEDIINQFLDKSTDDAEARMLARRQARAEARDIRMRELERQQKEQEENADRQFDMLAEPVARAARTSGSRYLSSRRSSEDSLEDGGSLREIRHELKEVEEKFRKAMIANAQLDNDKAAQTYQLELLKDRLEELEEEHSQLRREHRDKCREHDQLKRLSIRLKDELAVTKAELEERDRLIAEKGLVIVGEDPQPNEEQGPPDGVVNGLGTPKKALVSAENAHLLENAGEGSLDVRLARFAKEKGELQDQISHLKLELEEERSKRRKSNSSGITLNGPTTETDYDAADVQREVSKQLAEYKFRAQKSEQDVATLQATVARLESQVIRYKSASEVSEKSEEALKAEKRKLQREAREAMNRAEELETSNTHLLKRLDKLKNAKSALLKEL